VSYVPESKEIRAVFATSLIIEQEVSRSGYNEREK